MIQLFNKILFGHKKEWSTDICYCSVTKSCPTLCDSMDCSTPGFPVLHYLPEFAQTHVHWVRMPSKDLFLCCPLLLLPSIFCSITVFYNESALRIRWPKYWKLQLQHVHPAFSILPKNIQGWYMLLIHATLWVNLEIFKLN